MTPHQFKAGDRVRCISKLGYTGERLMLGGEYIVSNATADEWVYLDGPAGGGWDPGRFAKIGNPVFEGGYHPTKIDNRLLGKGGAPTRSTTLPDDAAGRKKFPVGSGFMDYFPDAICAVAQVSHNGNEQHNPGQPLHWARGKSMDHPDTMMRHYLQRGTRDVDGQRHTAKMVWRALAMLQQEIEDEQTGQKPYIDESVLPKTLMYRPGPLVPCDEFGNVKKPDVVSARRDLEEASETGVRF